MNPEKYTETSHPSKGLGDDVKKVAGFFMIDTLAERIAKILNKKDCGCEKRREILNRIVPYKIEK